MSAVAALLEEYGTVVSRARQAGDELTLCFDRLNQLEQKLREVGIENVTPSFPPLVLAALKEYRQDPFETTGVSLPSFMGS